MDKHTRPYTCLDASCGGINFGDKAGLLRHEREKHGALKYLCPISTCTRNRRGFARKRNLDAHIKTRHRSTSSNVEGIANSPESIDSQELMDEDQTVAEETGVLGDMSGLRTKLHDLETRKRELAACQAKVEEDIQAIKRTIQLVAT
jgi:hypothetical protein